MNHRRSPKNLTMNRAFPMGTVGNGIFSAMSDMPWSNDGSVTSEALDIYYYGVRSGGKFVAPIIYSWLDDEGVVTLAGRQAIVSAIRAVYLKKWRHIWSLYNTEYSPLDSYSVVETLDRTLNRDGGATAIRTDNLTETNTGTDTTASSGSDTTTNTPSGRETTTHSVYGFNSSEPSNDELTVTEPAVVTTDATTYGRTDTRTLNTSTANTGTQTSNEDTHSEDVEEYTRTRNGRMYNTPAEMMVKDRDFWENPFFDMVFSDLDKMLTLAIYSDSEVQSTKF